MQRVALAVASGCRHKAVRTVPCGWHYRMNEQKPLRLRKRAEFLAVRAGEKRRGAYFLIEVNGRADQDGPPRVGFTVTKKNGNAVVRNRIKRRLREAVRVNVADDMHPGTDYVIVARRDALNAPFADLTRELSKRVSKKTMTRRSAKP